MFKFLLVFLGGGLGSAARYALTLGVGRLVPASAPDARWGIIHTAGTLTVNTLGCLLIGFAWGRLGVTMREETRLLLVVGFLGGFTTFSAVGWESFNLIGRAQIAHTVAYIAVTLALGLCAVWLGHSLGDRAVPG